jgi:hypothetical protein
MNLRKPKGIYFFLLLVSFLLVLASCSDSATNTASKKINVSPTSISSKASCSEDSPTTGGTTPQNAPITVTVKQSCVLAVSNYAAGLTYNDNSLIPSVEGGDGNSNAVSKADTLIRGTLTYENTHIMGWGAVDPWPDPSTPDPTDWRSLDQRLQHMLAVGGTPVISLDEAPWWMKGQLQGDGTTKLLKAEDEWGNIAYGSRILDNKMGDWLHLIQRIAERYMVAPYNLRYFQVWNELKGYYNPQANNNDITTNAGDASGPNARHGYTYMYNQVYTTLMKTAQSLNIPTDSIKVGGPYVFMDIWRTSAEQSHPSNVTKAYGTFDQRPFDVLQYWLQHKVGAGFITFDASLQDRGGKELTDPFVAAPLFADTIKWLRALDPTLFPGSTTLPVWLSEWFASSPPTEFNADYDNAVKSLAMIDFIKAGGGTALSWGGSGDGTSDIGYWTPTKAYDGGEAHPWYSSVKTLTKDFGVGTKLYPAIVSDPQQVAALASDHHILLINKTAKSLSLTVNGSAQTLSAYQVVEINY